jgi:ABC-type amino acid transport substrate-binding protein
VKRIRPYSLAIVLAFAAHLGGPAAAQAPAADKGTVATTAAAPDTLARIRAAKRINVAFSGDSMPFSFVADNNQPSGYSIDLCQRVIAQIGRTLGLPDLATNWLVGSVTERIAMVASGKADLDCANTTATLTRMNDVDFSSLIFLDGGGLLVRDSRLQKLGDLAGKRIGVIGGTTTETRLNAMLRQNLVSARVTTVKDGNEGIAMLESATLDAFASDKLKLVGLAAQAKDPNALSLLAEDLSIEPYAFALPRNDSAFRLEVNKALTRVYVSGEIDAVFGPWLVRIGRPSGLLAAMYLLNSIPQ